MVPDGSMWASTPTNSIEDGCRGGLRHIRPVAGTATRMQSIRRQAGDGLPYGHRMSFLENWGFRSGRCRHRPVAVPGVRLADGAASLHTDRGHSLRSLHPPPAALPSLPNVSANSTTPALGLFYHGGIVLSMNFVAVIIILFLPQWAIFSVILCKST